METATQTHISATFNGEFISLVAAFTTIQELEDRQGTKHIWRMGEKLLKGLNDVINDAGVNAEAISEPYPPMPIVRFKDEDERIREAHELLWFRQAIGRGILVCSHVWFISLSHGDEEIDTTIEALGESFKAVKEMI
jgi:glutamate-1-semialdehyde aminotransferase